MRATRIALLGLLLCAAQVQAQTMPQPAYAGPKYDAASTCLSRQVEVLATRKIVASDFIILATGACQKPITAYRDFVILTETKTGTAESVARQRATDAMTHLFREASAAFTARIRGARDDKGLRLVELLS